MTVIVRQFQDTDLEGFVFREEDEAEAVKAQHGSCRGVIADALANGQVFTVTDTAGAPFSFFGKIGDEEGNAFIWMQSSTTLFKHGFAYIKGMVTVLSAWAEKHPMLYTYVNPKEGRQVRLLVALGFTAVRCVGYGNDPNNPYYEMVRLS